MAKNGVRKLKKSYENCSNFEKTLVLLLVFVGLIAFILFVILLNDKHHSEHLCTTPACLAAASHVMHTVDPTLDPCEDFYKFSCGNFMKNTFYRSQPSLMHELKELKTNQVFQMVVLDVEDEDKLPKSYQYVRKFYRKCFNTTEIDEDQDKTFLDSLYQVIEVWPLANGNAKSSFDWPDVMVKAKQIGMKSDFFLDINYKMPDNESQIYIEILPQDNYDKKEWHEDKVEHYVKIATFLGRTVPGAKAEMLKTMDFAKKLDHITEKCKNETKTSTMEHRKMTIIELQKSIKDVPILNWLDFLKNMTGLTNLTDQTVVIVSVTQEYFRELQLLMNHTQNNCKANFVAALLLIFDGQYLSSEIRKIVSTISPPYNYYRQKDRSKLCAENAINYFHGALEGAFIRKVITPDKRKDIMEMLNSIRHNLEISVNKTTWIDHESKDNLTKFLKNMTVSIGWTDLVFDVEKYEKYLKMDKLNLDFEKPILEIFHKFNKFRHSEIFKVVGHYSDKIDLEINDVRLDVNAYFMKLMNQLFLTAPLLQPPMYDIERPKYMNYGSLGSIIGHELTHGATHSHAVDEEMKRFSKEEYEQIWTNQTKENFVNATQCVVDEYDDYESESKFEYSLSGNETLEENVADFTGINVAYEAYQSWVRKHGHEKRLPGVKFTPNQLFWIMSATYVCTNEKLLEEVYSCKDDKHGEPRFRTNGPIRNSPYFARDFKCPLGSKMNPKDKCRVYL